MNIPLLQQDKSKDTFAINASGSPDKKMQGLFGAGILKKYEIKNEIIQKVKLPVAVSEDFLEKSVIGIKYKTVEEKASEIYDTTVGGRLTDPKKIFEGIRTKQVQVMKEHNYVSTMAEYNNIIYLGCKDGTILVSDHRTSNGGTKKFVPHQGKDVVNLSITDGFLVTLSVSKELIVWDVKHYFDSDRQAPETLKELQKVTGFELVTKNGKTTMYYCKDSAIYETTLQVGQEIENGEISTRALERLEKALKLYHASEGRILFADKQENVYLLTPTQDGDYDAKLLVEKSVGTQVKGMRLQDGIVTVVQNDSQTKETIFTTINLIRLEEDEAEQRRLDEEVKRKAQEEETKKAELGEEAFRLWKMQQHQLEASEAATLIKKKETGIVVEEVKEETKTTTILHIGECGGVSFSSNGEQLLVSGAHCILIYTGRRWENQLFEIKTEISTFKAQFSCNGNNIYIFGADGSLKTMEYRNPTIQYPPSIKDKVVQDVVGSRDGKYFATLSQGQSRITVYNYLDCSIVGQFDHMDYTYLMNFSANSSTLVCVQGTQEPQVFNIVMIKLDEKPENQVIIIPCKISEDFPVQVDASITKQEIYMICKTDTSSNLHVYGFNRRVKKTIRDAVALSVSTDEKILAYSNGVCQIHMIFIKQKLPDLPLNKSPQRKSMKSSPKKGSSPMKGSSPTKGSSMVTPEAPEEEENVMNTIQLPDNAYVIQFYGDNLRIAIQTASAVLGMDIYTHETFFKIQAASPKMLFKRIQVQLDDFINFCDSSMSLCVYDINYYLETDYVSIKTQAVKKQTLEINPIHKVEHAVWATVGNHFIVDLEEKLWFQANPFLHHQVENENVHSGPFESVEGFYVPTLLGGPTLGCGTFAQIYCQAIEKDNEDVTIMKTPIYPYKLNALHYFAMTSNVAGAEACFANKVKFNIDQFGKSPLDYAIATHDKLIIECILSGIDQMETEEKIKILRTLPLNLLVEHPAPVLANILLNNGASVPLDSKFGKGTPVPTLFPIKRQGFGESGLPYYSVEVARQIHPAKNVRPKAINRPVSTFVLNNPVPRNFTDDSLQLLGSIVDCSNDEIVRSKPITLYLNRKWDSYGFNFYFFQFIMFITLLMSLTCLDSVKNYYIILLSGIISATINTYFFIFEILQLCINGFDYFKSANNILDIGRLAAIYTYLFSVIDPEFELPSYVLPTTFCLMWFKILSYLSVFKPTRYLIKMIFEIINDIIIFLVILFTALFAYAQITYVLTGTDDKNLHADLVNSYVLSLGELGGFDGFGYLQFAIFMMFSFLVPLVLMNMLIALMADSYTRVQSNSVAADARALAEMLQEMEEVAQFVFMILRPSMIKNEFYYCFVTKVNDEEEEEDWEGTVGQLKRTIEEATAALETNLINAVEDLTKKNTEKIIDNLLRANKSELDVIDSVQSLLEKETNKIRTQFEEQLLDESQKVKDQFNKTLKKLEEDQHKVEQEFERTHNRLEKDYQEVKGEFLRTQEKLDADMELVKACQENLTGVVNATTSNLSQSLTQQISNNTNLVKEEFEKTQKRINEQGVEVKSELVKAQKDIETTSKQLQSEIKVAQEKVEKESSQMKEELKKAHTMITDVNSSVVSSSSKIVENVQNSTSKTQESLLKKIETQSKEDTSKVESQVEKQTQHHDEMVKFTVATQKKVTEMLTSTAEQQNKLLVLVDELKGMQNKGLESIKNSEQELIKKKDFENAQKEAVDQIKKLLSDIKALEAENSEKLLSSKKIAEEKEMELKAELKKIQDGLGGDGKNDNLHKEIKSISETLEHLFKKLGGEEESKQGKGKKKE